jgi:hypothetical protein
MCMLADSKGFDHQRHGICITNWWYILWSCYGQYGVCCGKRAWCFDHRIARKRDCKMVLHDCWHGRSSDTVMLIFWVLWFIWPRKLAEMCVSIWYTLWLKGMTSGVVNHREQACQLVSARLRGSRDSEDKIGTYLFHIWSYSHETLQRHVQGWYLHCGQRIWYLGSWFAGECENKLVPHSC